MEDLMIRKYIDATPSQRVDIIIRNYSEFMGIVDGYTEGLRYMIECDKDNNNREKIGELGVRVQSGGTYRNPTQNTVIRNMLTREALVKCDFSGNVMDGLDRAEEYIREAYVLKKMRNDYDLFRTQLCILGKEKELFELYLSKEIDMSDVAERKGISYEAAQQRIHNFRCKVKKQVVGYMERKILEIA